jgi:hypothetical protein
MIPGFGVSTSEAYGWYDGERELSRAPARAAACPGPVAVAGGADDQRPRGATRARHHPEIDQMKAALRRVGCARRVHGPAAARPFRAVFRNGATRSGPSSA